MWTLAYILSQIAVVFAVGVLASTYLIKSRDKILYLTIFYSLFYAVSYALIGAWIGVILNLVSIIRNVWFLIEFKKKGSINVVSLVITMCMLALSSIMIFIFVSFHPIELLALSETLVYTFSLWQNNNKVFRWIALYSSACWLTYNIYVFSLFAIILESALLVSKIVGIVLLYVKKKKQNMVVND